MFDWSQLDETRFELLNQGRIQGFVKEGGLHLFFLLGLSISFTDPGRGAGQP